MFDWLRPLTSDGRLVNIGGVDGDRHTDVEFQADSLLDILCKYGTISSPLNRRTEMVTMSVGQWIPSRTMADRQLHKVT